MRETSNSREWQLRGEVGIFLYVRKIVFPNLTDRPEHQ
jgi:hypothetical protein